mgnify:CR=1 FL=1
MRFALERQGGILESEGNFTAAIGAYDRALTRSLIGRKKAEPWTRWYEEAGIGECNPVDHGDAGK